MLVVHLLILNILRLLKTYKEIVLIQSEYKRHSHTSMVISLNLKLKLSWLLKMLKIIYVPSIYSSHLHSMTFIIHSSCLVITYKLFKYFLGEKEIEINFNTLEDSVDIHKSGLQFFTYCTSNFGAISSTLKTINLYLGGLGISKWLPFFNTHAPFYMVEQNK